MSGAICAWTRLDVRDGLERCSARAVGALYCAEHARAVELEIALGRLADAEDELLRWLAYDHALGLDVPAYWSPIVARMRAVMRRRIAEVVVATPVGESWRDALRRVDAQLARTADRIVADAPDASSAPEAVIAHARALRPTVRVAHPRRAA